MRKIVCAVWMTVLVALPMGATSAQDGDYPLCEFQSTQDILIGLLQEVQDWQQMEQFNAALSESLAFCRGLLFDGVGTQVVGPAHFPPGTYTLHLSGEGFTTVQGDLISGNCDAELLFVGIQDGQPSIEQPFNSLDCETTFNIQSEGSWLLRFEPIDVVDTDTPPGGDINYGAQIQGELPANNVTEYRFTSQPGDVVTITADALSETVDLQLDLFTPEGDLFMQNDDRGNGSFDPQLTAVPLPTAGDYRIVVRHCASCHTDEAASFLLSLEKIN